VVVVAEPVRQQLQVLAQEPGQAPALRQALQEQERELGPERPLWAPVLLPVLPVPGLCCIPAPCQETTCRQR
jgi:hypothetical protein